METLAQRGTRVDCDSPMLGRAWSRTLLAALLASCLSCADIPTAPRAIVTVTGHILDRDGQGIASLPLNFLSGDPLQGEGIYWNRTATTDADGRYSIPLPEARYNVLVGSAYANLGYPMVVLSDFVVGRGGATLDYRYQGVRVSGKVTGPGGAPIGDASLRLYRPGQAGSQVAGADGGPDGRYSLLVPAGSYDLEAGPLPYGGSVAVPDIRLRVGTVDADTTIDVPLTGAKLDLTVRLNGTIPLAGAYMTAVGPDASARARTDSSGAITLYLPAGGYAFGLLSADATIVSPDPFYLAVQSDAAVAVDVPTAHWTGTVRYRGTGEAGPDLAIALREVTPSTGYERYTSIRTSATGSFEFYVRPGRPYDVIVVVPGAGSAQFPARGVSSAADTTLDLLVDTPAP